MTGDGHRTVTPTEDDSETQPGGPQEAGAHQILLGFAEAGWVLTRGTCGVVSYQALVVLM